MTPAFRCKNCGRLEPAEHAGERSVPCACSVCGCGVSFDQRSGLPKFDPENWEVLAEATPERLADLGLTEVAKHEHDGKGDVPPRQTIAVHGVT